MDCLETFHNSANENLSKACTLAQLLPHDPPSARSGPWEGRFPGLHLERHIPEDLLLGAPRAGPRKGLTGPCTVLADAPSTN